MGAWAGGGRTGRRPEHGAAVGARRGGGRRTGCTGVCDGATGGGRRRRAGRRRGCGRRRGNGGRAVGDGVADFRRRRRRRAGREKVARVKMKRRAGLDPC
jgi:hypothetical protein